MSASDRSFKYMGSNRSAAPRAMRMASLAFMQASCWRNEKDTDKTSVRCAPIRLDSFYYRGTTNHTNDTGTVAVGSGLNERAFAHSFAGRLGDLRKHVGSILDSL